MADTAVAITAGTGTNIDTRTEGTNGNHRQVVVLGDPATNAGVAPVDATAGLKVDLGADNDVTLATLPDTASGDLAAIKAKTDNIPAQGQALAAASVPVVLPAAQITTLTPPAAITGFLTEADFDTKVGSLTETAPATDTASSGLNGRLQRIAQRITSLIALIPTSLGQKTKANSFAVTLASDQDALPITDNAGSLTVDAPVGTPVFVRLSDGAAAIATLPVSLASLPALPTGTNNIGDVDVLSVVPGTGATNLGKAIDTATGATDTGVLALATRDDALSALTPIEGDNVQLRTDSTGALWVKPSGTVTVDGSGVTQPVSGTFWQATQPVSLASVPSHAVTNAGTFAVQATEADGANTTLGAKADAKSTATDTTAVSVMSVLKQISASVQAPPSQAVTNAGTFATQVDGSALTALQLIDDPVFADDAAYTLSTSKGNVAAGVAVRTDGTDPTAVSAEGDAAALRTDMNRILLVNETHPRFWHVSADYASAQTNTSVKAAPGASLSLYITDIQISNGATAGNITLLDGSGGTVLYEIYPGINGGAVMSLRSPIKLTANTALCITSTTVTTHSIFVSGYIAP